jgi:hypothetical protein
MGFNFLTGSSMASFPQVWQEVSLATVNAATAGQNNLIGKFTLSAGYSGWLADFFPGITDPAVIGFNADPDNDGVPNGLEYAFASDPKVAGSTPLQATSTAAKTLACTHNRARNAAVTISYQWSADLATWYASNESDLAGNAVAIDIASVDTSGATSDVVHTTATLTLGTTTKFFVRAKATAP